MRRLGRGLRGRSQSRRLFEPRRVELSPRPPEGARGAGARRRPRWGGRPSDPEHGSEGPLLKPVDPANLERETTSRHRGSHRGQTGTPKQGSGRGQSGPGASCARRARHQAGRRYEGIQYEDMNRCLRRRLSPKPIMILPQVHLRKPCYDFYFLQAIEFERLLGQQSDACTSDRDQSEVLTEPLNR